jgi:ParB family chromosome partitioning protein
MSVKNMLEVDVSGLDPNPFQARIEYPESELRDLGNSIKEKGLLEPIVVRPKGDRYEIAVGERRARACKLMGMEKISAIVKELSDEQMAEYVLIENLQRKDLNAIEEAKGFKTLQERFGWTQEKIASQLGRGLTRDIVAQRLRLLTFPVELQNHVSHDTITPTHAETLARLDDDQSLLKEATAKVIKQNLSTKQTEQLVKDVMAKQEVRKRIKDYVTSEQFVLEFQYIATTALLTSSDMCPRCGGKVEWMSRSDQIGGGIDGYLCKDCGWEFGTSHGTLFDLVIAIEEQREAKKALGNTNGTD